MQPIARFFVLAFCIALATRAASAAVAGSVGVTVVDAQRHPVPNVDVALNGSKRFTATTDRQGVALFSNIPVDTYELTISAGEKSQVAMTVSVIPDRTQLYTVPLQAPARASPVEVPSHAPVHESLVTAYNAKYPVYTGDQDFGRYTYVLLFGSASANRSLIASLNTVVGPLLGVDNPLGYNLFAIPLNDKLNGTGDGSADWILKNYNYAEANTIRGRYCNERNHSSRSLCGMTRDSGPVLMTFLRPLDVDRPNALLPPAVVYDLSRVPEPQMDLCVRQLSKAGVQNVVPQVQIVKDADFAATSETPRAAISSESATASPRP